jgi:WD40 repeat protein
LKPNRDLAPVARSKLPLQADEILDAERSQEFGFASAGDKVVSIRGPQEVVIYSSDPTKTPVVLRHPDKQHIVACRFSADGRMILTRSKSGLVYVWSAETGQQIHEPLDMHVQIWSFDDLFFGRPSHIDEQGSPPELKDALFSPDGNWIATRTAERSLRLWHLHDAAPPRELRAHFGCDHIVFSGDGGQVAAADGDEVRVWSMQRPEEPLTFTQPDRVLAAAVPADRSFVLTKGGDGIARIWPFAPGRMPQELKPGSSKAIDSIDCDKDASAIAVAYANGEIRLWRPGAPDPFRIFSEHVGEKSTGYVHVLFAPDHRRMVSWADQSMARIWRRDGAGQSVVIRPTSPILDTAFDPAARVLVTGHVDSRLRGWDAETGRLLFELTSGKEPETLMVVRISPDGRWILAGSSDGTARVWTFDRSCVPMVFPLAPYAAGLGGRTLWVSSAEFSPDSSSVGICTMNGQVRVANLATGRSRVLQNASLRTGIGPTADVGPIAYMAFSPDGRYLATCSAMLGWVQVWPLAGEQTPIRIQGIGSALFAEFTVDGSRIITANEGGAVQVWRTGWKELTEHLRSRTTAVLLTDQRMQLLGENASTARKAYEADERRYGRTPLPNTSDFIYVELDR